MTQNDVMQLFIGKDVGAGSPTTATGAAITSYTDLLDGEMAITNAHNLVLGPAEVLTNDLVAQYGIKVIQRSGTKLIESDLIMQSTILNYKGETGAAASEQLSYIGYNGSANSIEVNNSTLYVIRLLLKELSMTGQGQEAIFNIPFSSDANATQEEIALGLAQQASRTLRRQESALRAIKAELVCDRASTGANYMDNTGTVVQGSNIFSVVTDVDYNNGSSTLVVGDYVRFSGDVTATGTSETDGAYKVTAINTLDITVDRPIEVAGGTFPGQDVLAATGNTILAIPAASAAVAAFGLKLTGIARSFSLPKHRYSKVEFDIGIDDGFGETVTTLNTAMSLGRGTYEQIAELEYDLLGNDGDIYKGDFLWTAHKSDAVSGAQYITVSLNYYGNHPTQGIGVNPRRPKQLQLAFVNGYADGESPDLVIETLDSYTTIASGLAK